MKPLHQAITVIAVVSVLVYANTLFGGLVFDDNEAIVNNRDVRYVHFDTACLAVTVGIIGKTLHWFPCSLMTFGDHL